MIYWVWQRRIRTCQRLSLTNELIVWQESYVDQGEIVEQKNRTCQRLKSLTNIRLYGEILLWSRRNWVWQDESTCQKDYNLTMDGERERERNWIWQRGIRTCQRLSLSNEREQFDSERGDWVWQERLRTCQKRRLQLDRGNRNWVWWDGSELAKIKIK